MKHSIKRAVWVRVVLIALSLLLGGIITVLNLHYVREYSRSSKQSTELLTFALNAEKAHLSWIENLSSAVGLGTEFTGSSDPVTCTLGKWIYESDENLLDPQTADLIRQIEPLHKQVHASATDVLSLKSKNRQLAIEAYQEKTKTSVTKLLSLLDQVVQNSQKAVTENEKALDKAILTTVVVSIISILLVFYACYLLIRYIVRRVVNPIQQITLSAKQLSEGNLDFHINISSDDEIGVLAQSLNQSGDALSLYIHDISNKLEEIAHGNLILDNDMQYIGDFVTIHTSIGLIIDNLNDTMYQIHQAAIQVSNGSDQIAESSQILAQGAAEQSQEIEHLLSGIHDIANQINSNAQDAALTNETSLEVRQQIELCNHQMQEMVNAMQEISRSSQQISNIIKTIDDIAFQTNILALNAAVEAARAGAAGKGFAVVADEVRNLASKSAEAAQSTTALIEQSLASVRSGAVLLEATQKSLDKVVEGAHIVTEKVENISESSGEQSEAISNINVGVSQISQVVQTNSATSEETAAASEELSGQAQALQLLVNAFRIKGSSHSISR